VRAVYISPATAPFCVNFARIYKSLPRAGGSSALRRYEAGRGLSLSQYIFSNVMRRSTAAASFSRNRGIEKNIISNVMRRSVYPAADKRKTGRRFALSVLKFRLCVNRRMTAGARRTASCANDVSFSIALSPSEPPGIRFGLGGKSALEQLGRAVARWSGCLPLPVL